MLSKKYIFMCSALFVAQSLLGAPPEGGVVQTIPFAMQPSVPTSLHVRAFKGALEAMDDAQQAFVLDPSAIDVGREDFGKCLLQVQQIRDRLKSTVDTFYPSDQQTSFGDLEGRQLLQRTKLFFDAINERLQEINGDFGKIPQGDGRRILRKKNEVVDAINYKMLGVQEDIETLFNEVTGAPSLPQRTEKIKLSHLWHHFVDSYSQKLPSEVVEFLNIGTRNLNRFVLKTPIVVPQLSAASEQRAQLPQSNLPPIEGEGRGANRESLLPPSMQRPIAPAQPDQHEQEMPEGGNAQQQQEPQEEQARPEQRRSFFGIFGPSATLEELETERIEALGGARRAAESIKNLLQNGCFARRAFNATKQTMQGLFEPSRQDGRIKTFVKRIIGGSVNLTGRFARWVAFKTRVLKKETYTTQSAGKARQELDSMRRAYNNQPEPIRPTPEPVKPTPSWWRRLFLPVV